MIRVALVQHACQADANANLEHIARQIAVAAEQGAQLVLLEELHNGPYFCVQEQPDNFDLAETIPGPSTEHLGKLAAQHGLVIVCSLFEKRAAGLYHNTAVVLDRDGSIAGKYRKMHIPDDPGYYEKFYFTPGDLGFEPVKTSLGTLGVLVCWDQWYPEAARIMALKGAELLLYPTAIGWDPNDDDAEQQRQLDAWINIQRSHAVANNLHVLSCNRIGFEADPSGHTSGSRFWGHSFVCGPQGEMIVQSNDTEDTVLIADIELEKTEQTRRIWPYLRDRRIDAYGEIVRRFID
jgi:N-carbamoylputrescine amidase